MGKAISETVYNAWVGRMEDFLLCFQKDRLLFQRELYLAEKQFEKENNCELSLNDDFLDGTNQPKRGYGKGQGKRKGKPAWLVVFSSRSRTLTHPWTVTLTTMFRTFILCR